MEETYSVVADPEEAERVLALAESNPVFKDVAQLCADLVDTHGYPERNIEEVFGDRRNIIVLFRLMRIAAEVNRRLAGKQQGQRLTEEEWQEMDRARQKQRMSKLLGTGK